MDYPKISIISPSYNQGIFVEEAILSVLNQNYPNFEHIIIDGGSKDNTVEILKKYPHVKWVSEADEGQSDAINKGFNLATGDIIGWLNVDDYYLNNIFERISNYLSGENTDAIYSNYYFVNSLGKITRNIITNINIPSLLLFYCYIPSTTFFFKRKILDEGIRIDKHFHICMDKEFFAHINKKFKIKFVNDHFACFRWHDSNKSIDTLETKKIRYKEGINILNRYGTFIRLNADKNLHLEIYRLMLTVLKPVKFLLKNISQLK